ncbi:MAG: hypothetical protein GY918_04870 [Gammaproteobacteria bacterium]|nr:hypothetical protein [Gammaproteobacteria bacterium]
MSEKTITLTVAEARALDLVFNNVGINSIVEGIMADGAGGVGVSEEIALATVKSANPVVAKLATFVEE